ncbi:MAG: hypothetical protein M1333_01835 [Patescibacteria group bacterium]|nr:hypothetical protein [Patescibacteria group bacterium]
MTNQHKISWQAPEYRHYEKNAGWYVTLVSIVILIMAFFIVQKDVFAAVTTGLLGILVVIFSRQKPETVEMELDHKRVKVGNIEVPYKQIKHFWVVHNEKHKTVNLETTTLVNNMLILELEHLDPEHVRMFLSQYLPEHEETEPTMVQRITHWFKF